MEQNEMISRQLEAVALALTEVRTTLATLDKRLSLLEQFDMSDVRRKLQVHEIQLELLKRSETQAGWGLAKGAEIVFRLMVGVGLLLIGWKLK